MQRFVSLDVSELEPPQPMEAIFTRLKDLDSGAALRVNHRREPYPIYSMLKEMGFSHLCVQREQERFEIFIWPTDDIRLGRMCRQAAKNEQHP